MSPRPDRLAGPPLPPARAAPPRPAPREPAPNCPAASRPTGRAPYGTTARRCLSRCPQDDDPTTVPPADNALKTERVGANGRRTTPPPEPRPQPRPRPRPRNAHLPTSMASPTRDGDLRRTFPAFPPKPSKGTSFAETWWGKCLGHRVGGRRVGRQAACARAELCREGQCRRDHRDAGARARVCAGQPPAAVPRTGAVADAGRRRLGPVPDAAADRPGHIAALLDKEMPKSLAECGVPLLPGPGDLDPHCSCPDVGHPCKHAAALCYQTARLLDADPFVLLLLRGRGERPLLDALSRRNAARAARAAQEQEPAPLPGVRATEALATERRLPPLPPPLPTPPHPEQPPVYPAAPGGPDPFALDQLATDAAARAHALLSTGRDPVGELTLWQDAVRLAAARPGLRADRHHPLPLRLPRQGHRTHPGRAGARSAAWRQGGIEGLRGARRALGSAGRPLRPGPPRCSSPPTSRPSAPWHNHLTHPHGHVQLRAWAATRLWSAPTSPNRAMTTGGPGGTPGPGPGRRTHGFGRPPANSELQLTHHPRSPPPSSEGACESSPL
ncbi:SWIM zinc finger family protein [Streptomyces sp. L7]